MTTKAWRLRHPDWIRNEQSKKVAGWTAGNAKNPKRVKVLYKGCADADEMSMEEYNRITYAFPEGTKIWIDGKEVE